MTQTLRLFDSRRHTPGCEKLAVPCRSDCRLLNRESAQKKIESWRRSPNKARPPPRSLPRNGESSLRATESIEGWPKLWVKSWALNPDSGV